jgi:hypothetical protein
MTPGAIPEISVFSDLAPGAKLKQNKRFKIVYSDFKSD